MNKLVRYFKGVNREAHRIRWPMKKFLWTNVLVVVSIVVISCVAIFLLDYFTLKLFQNLNFGIDSSSSSSSSLSSTIAALVTLFYSIL